VPRCQEKHHVAARDRANGARHQERKPGAECSDAEYHRIREILAVARMLKRADPRVAIYAV